MAPWLLRQYEGLSRWFEGSNGLCYHFFFSQQFISRRNAVLACLQDPKTLQATAVAVCGVALTIKTNWGAFQSELGQLGVWGRCWGHLA